jgi:ferredoxin-nitrite reductase
VGKMMAQQMRDIAAIARDCGDGDIRLTVWQNFLISGIPAAKLDEAKARIEATGFGWKASSIRAGLVACTGAKGCRFAASDTKGHAEDIAAWCEPRVALEQPVNIHLTGCHHSCAQHYIGDIGLIGARVSVSDDGDTVEGYNIVAGGGFGNDSAIGREFLRDVKAEDAPRAVERLLNAWRVHRAAPDESFQNFANRHDVEALAAFATTDAEESAP